MPETLFDQQDNWPIHGCAGSICEVCANERKRRELNPPTPARHLARSDGPATSKAAAKELPVTDLEWLVLTAIRQAGTYGMTQDELLQQFPNLSYSSVTARPAALKERGLIIDSGDKRVGRSGRRQTVLIAAEYIQTTLG